LAPTASALACRVVARLDAATMLRIDAALRLNLALA
jgi:hypothetical protein